MTEKEVLLEIHKHVVGTLKMVNAEKLDMEEIIQRLRELEYFIKPHVDEAKKNCGNNGKVNQVCNSITCKGEMREHLVLNHLCSCNKCTMYNVCFYQCATIVHCTMYNDR